MKQIFKSLSCYLLFVICYLSFVPSPVFAQAPLPTSSFPQAQGVVEIQALETVFSNILTIATTLAGLAAFVMLIAGGLKWLTSGGNPKSLEAAKGTVTTALLGLIGLVLIWLVLYFISQFTGRPELLQFKIPR